jgi:hypothetical protein
MHITYLRNYIKFYKKQEMTTFYWKTYDTQNAPKTALLSVQMGWHKANEKYRVTLSYKHGEITQSMPPE